jgi:CheY-like chemotaxis protein
MEHGASQPATAERTAGGRGVRVLVVDDNVDLVLMVTGTLRHKGYSVRSAFTGPEGLKIAQEWLPDIALLDIGLPGLDGYEVARRLRSSRGMGIDTDAAVDGVVAGNGLEDATERSRIKLIALTGYGREADILLSREAGFDGHLVKPCDFDELEGMMDRLRK